jgi:acetyl esterase/lipase
MQRESLIKNSEIYFNPWDTTFEGNPRRILERGESGTLPPMFILQGEWDDHVLPVVQERFAATYRAAGGEIDLAIYPGAEPRSIIQPGAADGPRDRDDQSLHCPPVAGAAARGLSRVITW